MTETYFNEILNEFDQEFESLVIPFPEPDFAPSPDISYDLLVDDSNQLKRIMALAIEMSAERYRPSYNPEICLANLLNVILGGNSTDENDFFQLLTNEREVDLEEALTDFDFYRDNPYKHKAERILSKIEAKKSK